MQLKEKLIKCIKDINKSNQNHKIQIDSKYQKYIKELNNGIHNGHKFKIKYKLLKMMPKILI